MTSRCCVGRFRLLYTNTTTLVYCIHVTPVCYNRSSDTHISSSNRLFRPSLSQGTALLLKAAPCKNRVSTWPCFYMAIHKGHTQIFCKFFWWNTPPTRLSDSRYWEEAWLHISHPRRGRPQPESTKRTYYHPHLKPAATGIYYTWLLIGVHFLSKRMCPPVATVTPRRRTAPLVGLSCAASVSWSVTHMRHVSTTSTTRTEYSKQETRTENAETLGYSGKIKMLIDESHQNSSPKAPTHDQDDQFIVQNDTIASSINLSS